jgi:hypothetical protein
MHHHKRQAAIDEPGTRADLKLGQLWHRGALIEASIGSAPINSVSECASPLDRRA